LLDGIAPSLCNGQAVRYAAMQIPFSEYLRDTYDIGPPQLSIVTI